VETPFLFIEMVIDLITINEDLQLSV